LMATVTFSGTGMGIRPILDIFRSSFYHT